MAHLQLALVAGCWLSVLVAAVRRRLRAQPHRRWIAGFETLRTWDQSG